MSANTTLERTLAILDLFTEERLEWTPEELMEELGYARPTLYRYLKTLKDAGFLISIPNAGVTLGPRVVELDFLMRKSDALVIGGERHLAALTADYPATALLVRWYGNKLLCVASQCSTQNPLSSYPRGRPMPLARGAISRAIMAFLPKRKLVPSIKANLADLAAIGLGDSVAEVLESFKTVRRQGFAVAHGEVTPGVVGIAAPVFDGGESPIACLCLTIAAARVDTGKIADISLDIRARASLLSDTLSQRRADEERDKVRDIA